MRRSSAMTGGLLLVLTLCGCNGGGGGEAYIVRWPQWPYENYERLAVLPGRAVHPRATSEAHVLGDRLTTLLTQNGAFTVLSRAELADVFKEQDLALLATAVDEGTAMPAEQIEVAQALVVPSITDYQLIADRETRTIPIIKFDSKGRPRAVGERRVNVYRHAAEVEGSLRVVDASTGRILVSHTARIVPREKTATNRPPSTSPEELAALAVRELATEFARQIAPVRVEVDFDKDSLILATTYFDGEYDDFKKVPRDLPSFLLVVRELEPPCDRNEFRVAIAAEDTRANLFESEPFVWSGSSGPEGITFDIPADLLLESGAEKFVAKLYAIGNPEPVIERDFKLESPDD